MSSSIAFFRCPDCFSIDLSVHDSGYVCDECSRLLKRKDGVLDTLPAEGIRLPELYNDPNLQKWLGMWDEGHDYFYRSSGIVAWVQNAGHRVIRKWRLEDGPKQDTVLLDLGCGDGAHLDYAGEVGTYVGLDMDPAGLKQVAAANASNVKTLVPVMGDGYVLPFRDNVFDEVISIYSLEHLVYIDLCLEEVSRVLAPGGIFYVSVPNEGGLAWNMGRALSSSQHFNSDVLDYDRVIAIEHINCIWQIEKALKRHFKLSRMDRFPLKAPGKWCNLVSTYRCTV